MLGTTRQKPDQIVSVVIAGLIILVAGCKGFDSKTALTQPIMTPAGSDRTAGRASTERTRPAAVSTAERPLLTAGATQVGNTSTRATATFLPTSSPEATLTATPAPTETPLPWSERELLGYSVQDREIEVVRLGTGRRWFAAVAAIHGAHECHTSALAEGMVERLLEEPELLPADVTVFVVPLANPDGCALDTRHNANGVDLNRNWDTDDWTADAQGPEGVVPGSGGPHPLSEPETILLHDWLLALRRESPDGELRIISYHSAVPDTGLAQPAYGAVGRPDPASEELAMAYAEESGYRYSPVWVGTYHITGELIHWAAENGFTAIDVELPDRQAPDNVPASWSESHLETNLRALLHVVG